MVSNLEIRILLPTDEDAITKFARELLHQAISDEMDVEMQTWVARWRPEALAYYLPQGWCFGAFQNGKLCGFLLGQPLLFFRGLTQTYWIEELVFTDDEIGRLLLDTAYKWAKDKHLQCVLIEGNQIRARLVEDWNQAHQSDEPMIEIRSSRF